MKIESIGATVPSRPIQAVRPVTRRRKTAEEAGEKVARRRPRASAPFGQGEHLDIEV